MFLVRKLQPGREGDLFMKNNGKRSTVIKIVLIILVAIVLRAPYASVPFFNVDEALIAVMADTILEGGVLYRDAWEHQTPLSYFVYALVFFMFGKNNMTAIHLFGIAWIIFTALMIYRLANEIYGSEKQTGFLAALFYVIFISTYESWDVLAVNTEIFLVLPVTAAVFFLLRGEKTGNPLHFILSGLLCALGAMTKQTGGMVLPALLFHLLLVALLSRATTTLSTAIKRCLMVMGGYTLVVGVIIFYFWSHNALRDFFYLTVEHPYQYSSLMDLDYIKFRLKVRTLDIVVPNLFLWGTAGLTTSFILLRGVKKCMNRGINRVWTERDRGELLLVLWLFSSLVALSMSGRFFGHYYIQAFPVLSLLTACGVNVLPAKILKQRLSTTYGRVLVSVVVLIGILFPLVKYQKKNIVRFIIQREDPQLPYDVFEASFKPVADYIREHSTKEDYIFVWGFCPQIYVLSDRKPASRFIFCNFLTGRMTESPRHFDPAVETTDWITPGSWEMLADDLGKRKPKFIIDVSPSDYLKYAKYSIKKYPYFQRLLETNYRLVTSISGMDLYQLNE